MTKSEVNCIEDYSLIYDTDQLRSMVSEEQFKELNIDDEDIQFVDLRCSNCEEEVGVRDTFNKYYIFFNAL
jgi:hypothetical protein